MKRILAGAILAALGLNAAWAGGVSDTEIVIGTHLDLSGPVAAGMPQLRNGMQMRFDEANEAGGINGRKIKLIVEDNASQPQTAVRAVDKLIRSDDVFAIINPFGSGTNAAVVKRSVDAGVLYFSPWGASSVLQRIGGNSPLMFTTVANYDTTTAAALGWMIDEYKIKKVGYVYMEGPLGDLVGRGVKSALDARGLTLVAQAGYKPGDIDFSSQVARMQAAGAELIVAASIIRETIGIAGEVKKLGLKDVKVLTGTPGRTIIVAQLGKDAVEGLYGVGTWSSIDPPKAQGEVLKWAEDFKKRYNLAPDENALLAYAYADWLVKGLQAAGRGLTADTAAKALQATTMTHPVLYDTKRFKENHASPESVKVEQLKGGVWTPVSPLLNEK
jgi:branched-chain amino acid transport system substrate-binding protein